MEGNSFHISVVYLSFTPYGTGNLLNFLESYKKNFAGVQHQLVLLFKGMENEDDLIPFIDIANSFSIPYQALYYPQKEGIDIDAYFFAAEQCHTKYILFFNSASTIEAPGWLMHYNSAMAKYGKAVIGTTASYQSHYSSVFFEHKLFIESGKGLTYHVRKYKLFLKAFFYWRFLFKPFPNPHLRTNAFMVNREDFLSIYPGLIATKLAAYKFESGRQGFTNLFIKMGYKVFVIDKNGNLYEPSEWHKSKTFWQGEQENLLVSDNQTRLYNKSSTEEKKQLSKKAWGKHE